MFKSVLNTRLISFPRNSEIFRRLKKMQKKWYYPDTYSILLTNWMHKSHNHIQSLNIIRHKLIRKNEIFKHKQYASSKRFM